MKHINLKFFDIRFLKFLMVGGINALFGYLTYALLIFLSFHYVLAALLSTVLGVLFNFNTTGRLVFKSRDNKLLFKFVGVYLIILPLNIFALKIFRYYEFDMYLAGFILLLPMALIAFALNKKFVFKGQQ